MYHGHCPACAKKIQRERGIEGKRRSRERKRQVCIELSAKNDRVGLADVIIRICHNFLIVAKGRLLGKPHNICAKYPLCL